MSTFREQAIAYLKDELAGSEKTAFEEALAYSEELRAELEASRELLDLLETANEEAAVKKVNEQIQQALRAGATMLHMTYELGATILTFRVDGTLVEAARYKPTADEKHSEPEGLQKQQHQVLVTRWKVMAEMNVAERQVPQDGRIAVRYQGKNYDLRVNVIPTINGERITARIHCHSDALPKLDGLGLQPRQQAVIKRLTQRPYGLILVAGLAGSGKTTLMYSMLNAIQEVGDRRKNILTVEHPVEYPLRGISQVAVNRHVGLTFGTALRVCMNADPDVVMLGEIQDLESAQLAVHLAMARSLVVTQLHVPSALSVPQRLQDIGVSSFMVAHALTGVIGTRLVRRICPECRAEYTPASDALWSVGLSAVEDGPFLRGTGCDACHQTGYQGRIGLFEVLEVNQELRESLATRATPQALWKQTFGRFGGSLWDDARFKIRQGLTTVEEVHAALFDYPHPTTMMDILQAPRYEIHNLQ